MPNITIVYEFDPTGTSPCVATATYLDVKLWAVGGTWELARNALLRKAQRVDMLKYLKSTQPKAEETEV